jgi:TonB family protein
MKRWLLPFGAAGNPKGAAMKRAVGLLLLLLFTAAPKIDNPFIDPLADSAEALKKGDYAAALKIDERLIDRWVERLGPGNEESKWFSVIVAHKALALAGLGREDDAIWYWHVALNLYPAIVKSDMSMFGSPGEFLKQHLLARPAPDLRRLDAKPPPGRNIRAPRTLRRVEPRYPRGAQSFGIHGTVVLEMIIDKSGAIRDVTMLKGLPAPTLSYCAMEALRQWKFAPATLDDQPIDVIFNLTINYH